MNLAWYREYKLDSIPTTVIGTLGFKWEMDLTW